MFGCNFYAFFALIEVSSIKNIFKSSVDEKNLFLHAGGGQRGFIGFLPAFPAVDSIRLKGMRKMAA